MLIIGTIFYFIIMAWMLNILVSLFYLLVNSNPLLKKYPIMSQKFGSFLQIDYQAQKIRSLETMIAYCYEDLKKAISGRDRRT